MRALPAPIAAAMAAVTALVTAGTVASPAEAATYAPFSGTPSRWIISHRGGPALYPEEGYRGYDASVASGFAIEADARQLKDGYWVLIHDATVDRTMRGVTGAVTNLTASQWNNAYLKPDPAGKYRYDRPASLGGFFNRYGGKVPIVLEHKGGSVDGFINIIKVRGLQGSVMAQSFDWTIAKKFKAAGLIPMFLMGTEFPVSPSTIKSAGIRYVGVSKDMGAWHVQQLRNAGLVIVSYTVNTKSNFSYELNQGVNGVFSDNPWLLR